MLKLEFDLLIYVKLVNNDIFYKFDIYLDFNFLFNNMVYILWF